MCVRVHALGFECVYWCIFLLAGVEENLKATALINKDKVCRYKLFKNFRINC